jgi:hypothetical protein
MLSSDVRNRKEEVLSLRGGNKEGNEKRGWTKNPEVDT